MESDMYWRGPVWSRVQTMRGYTAETMHRFWIVASHRKSGDPKMAFAWRQLDGTWTYDYEGTKPLDFEPDWFGEPPYLPPRERGINNE